MLPIIKTLPEHLGCDKYTTDEVESMKPWVSLWYFVYDRYNDKTTQKWEGKYGFQFGFTIWKEVSYDSEIS